MPSVAEVDATGCGSLVAAHLQADHVLAGLQLFLRPRSLLTFRFLESATHDFEIIQQHGLPTLPDEVNAQASTVANLQSTALGSRLSLIIPNHIWLPIYRIEVVRGKESGRWSATLKMVFQA